MLFLNEDLLTSLEKPLTGEVIIQSDFYRSSPFVVDYWQEVIFVLSTCDCDPGPGVEVDDVERVHPQLGQTVVKSEITEWEESDEERFVLQLVHSTAALGVVHADLGEADLEELGDVDGEGGEDGGKDVGEDPGVGVGGLELSVVVRSADRQVALHRHGYDEVDAEAENYPDVRSGM